jgi:predicted RNA-binding protein (virulence factor B family)
MATLGRRSKLSVIRESAPGLYLNGGELGEILLPRRYIPDGLKQGDKLDVFIYLDSEDRLVATTETPHAMVGEFAALEVVSINPKVGVFLNWGLAKDLLLPFTELEKPPRVGQKIVVMVCLDSRSNRIVASARLKRHLNREPAAYATGQPVNLLITGQTPLGYNAIVEAAHLGLLFADNFSAPLETGEQVKAFVRKVREDGKIDLSLDPAGYKRVVPLKMKIIEMLEENHGRLEFDDDTSPEVVRAIFGASKKSFKQALGALYKSRRIRFLNPGVELLDNSSWKPGQ